MLQLTALEPECQQRRIQLGVPCSRGLTGSLERLDKAQHLVLLSSDDEHWELGHEHLFMQLTIEEGRFYIHMVDWPSLAHRVR